MSILKSIGLAALLIGLNACQPADLNTMSVRERLESGQLIEHSEKGFIYGGCKNDWTRLELGNDQERKRTVLGQQGSIVEPGRNVCFRVGSDVDITVNRDTRKELGRARITRIAWIKIDALKNYQLKGSFFASAQSFYTYKDSVRARMDKYDKGLVTVVDFIYLRGSAVDEKSIVDGDGSHFTPQSNEGLYQ